MPDEPDKSHHKNLTVVANFELDEETNRSKFSMQYINIKYWKLM